jgi:cytochrome c biogenesis protein CcmG/thiol:disulfide interchange protein DsbE
MMFISIGIGTVVAVVLIAIVSVLTGGKVTNSPSHDVNKLVGQHVGSFSLGGLNGGEEHAPWLAGHPSVLIFFASWCGPCQGEMPKVAAYVRKHPPGSVVVMGIDANDSRGAAQAFVAKDRVTFPIAFDANGEVTSGDFGFSGLPQTVFINAKGIVTNVYVGAIPSKQLASGIKALTTS